MKRCVQMLLVGCLTFFPGIAFTQDPLPFDSCPGVSVAVTRPGFNNNFVAHQIYLIDTAGVIIPSGDPIDQQANAFGLNNEDGFLYAMFPTFNVANPFFARVGKNGKYKILGTIEGPPVPRFKLAIVNTAAGTVDDEDNYYFTAVVINLQNASLPPDVYVGKIRNISKLPSGIHELNVNYKKLAPGTCMVELLNALQNPTAGVLQDIAYNARDGKVYTYLRGAAGAGGKIAWFNPSSAIPTFNCITPSALNASTADLCGLYFGRDSALYILTTDGNYYSANIQSGIIDSIGQTTLPLENNNLRGDMASCVGRKKLHPFEDCPDIELAITRPGINSTGGPHHIYRIKSANGSIRPVGHDINLQINAFGLNNKDGFLYGMHEVSDVFGPRLARVDSSGDYVDIDTIRPPVTSGSRKGIINTAAATMDGHDNYYFTAVIVDTANLLELPKLYLGTIKNVSELQEGDSIEVTYDRIFLGSCVDEIVSSLSNPANGLLQDIAYNPKDGRIYTYIQSHVSPAPGKLASFRPDRNFMILSCNTPYQQNPATQDLSGMHGDKNGQLYILTTDGKYYRGNPNNGKVHLVAQTTLPLLGNNLRGDMASCIKDEHVEHHDGDDDDHDHDRVFVDDDVSVGIAPNPVTASDAMVFVNVSAATDAELRVVDVNGSVGPTIKSRLAKGDNEVRVPVRGLKSGMYAIAVAFPTGKTVTVKFVRL
jgi:hypothetical protein